MKIRYVFRRLLAPLPGGNRLMAFWRKGRASLNVWRKRRRLQRYGLEILSAVRNALEKNTAVVYHADYGTLLGLIRENGFIKHDDDMDFSVYDGTISPAALHAAMTDAGFSFMRGFRYGGVVTELAFLYKKVSVDFFYVFSSESGNYSQVYNDFRADADGFKAHFAERLSKPCLPGVEVVDIKGVKVNIPANKEDFLCCSYGKGWPVPVRDWKREDGDLTKRTVLPDCAEIFHSADCILGPIGIR